MCHGTASCGGKGRRPVGQTKQQGEARSHRTVLMARVWEGAAQSGSQRHYGPADHSELPSLRPNTQCAYSTSHPTPSGVEGGKKDLGGGVWAVGRSAPSHPPRLKAARPTRESGGACCREVVEGRFKVRLTNQPPTNQPTGPTRHNPRRPTDVTHMRTHTTHTRTRTTHTNTQATRTAQAAHVPACAARV